MHHSDIQAQLCKTDDSCLIIVDVQTRLAQAIPAKRRSAAFGNIGILLQAAQRLDVPVLVTEQYPKGLGTTEPELNSLLTNDTPKFEKTCFACSSNKDFLAALKASGRRQLILTGMEAHICILQTAMQLIAEDYALMVVADAVCSRNKQDYKLALQRMRGAGCTLCSTESVLFEWLGDSRHRHFKELSQLLPK